VGLIQKARQWIGIAPKPVAPTKTVGAAGTAIYGGYIQPIERNPDLHGARKYTTYSNILANTSIVAAGVRHFLELISKAKWKLELPDDAPAEQVKRTEEILEMVWDALTEMVTPWHRVVRRAAMYRLYGFSLQEWTAMKREDGTIVYKDVESRAQKTIERWDTDYHGHVFGCVQRAPQDSAEIYLPINKLLYMVDDSLDDSPEGLGLFRHITKTANELTRYEQLEGFGYEADLRGIPIGRAPFEILDAEVAAGKISEAEKSAKLAAIIDFMNGHIKNPDLGLLLESMTYETTDEAATPSQQRKWDMDLLKGGATSHGNMDNAIRRKNREIARVLGVEHLLLGEGQRGSASLSKDKNRQFAMMVDGTLQELVETVERDLIHPLYVMNGWDETYKITAKTEAIQHREVEEVTGALADMAQAGAILDPEDPVISEVRDLLGLSKPLVITGAIDAALDRVDPDEDELPEAQGDGPAGTSKPKDTPEGTGDEEETE
jgi:hypothetical protein